jgi:hypothetical protein
MDVNKSIVNVLCFGAFADKKTGWCTIRGCTHKDYASLDKNEKKFHVLFPKIATYQSTPKIMYVHYLLKGTKEETKEEPKRESKPPHQHFVAY